MLCRSKEIALSTDTCRFMIDGRIIVYIIIGARVVIGNETIDKGCIRDEHGQRSVMKLASESWHQKVGVRKLASDSWHQKAMPDLDPMRTISRWV